MTDPEQPRKKRRVWDAGTHRNLDSSQATSGACHGRDKEIPKTGRDKEIPALLVTFVVSREGWHCAVLVCVGGVVIFLHIGTSLSDV